MIAKELRYLCIGTVSTQVGNRIKLLRPRRLMSKISNDSGAEHNATDEMIMEAAADLAHTADTAFPYAWGCHAVLRRPAARPE